MSDQGSSSAIISADIRRGFARIALEILVGFIGVYAAFALAAYHERQAETERRHQLKRALIVEVKNLTELMRRNVDYGLPAFDSAVASGKKPIPRPFIEAVNISPHMWDAIKQSGGLTLIDVPTFAKAADFYNDISEMLGFYAQLRELARRAAARGDSLIKILSRDTL